MKQNLRNFGTESRQGHFTYSKKHARAFQNERILRNLKDFSWKKKNFCGFPRMYEIFGCELALWRQVQAS